MKKKFACLLFAFGFIVPAASFFFSGEYEGEGSWFTRIYEGQIVLKEGVRVKDFRRPGTPDAPRVSADEVRSDLNRLADPKVPVSEKAELLARADREFQALPPGEREKVLGVLTPGELAGAYISAAGYRVDQVLGVRPYLQRSAVPYRYVVVAGIALILLGAMLLVL